MSDRPILSVSILDRWRLFGGYWRLVEISEEQASIELCACTGEPLERLQTHDLEMIRYLRGADSGTAERQ